MRKAFTHIAFLAISLLIVSDVFANFHEGGGKAASEKKSQAEDQSALHSTIGHAYAKNKIRSVWLNPSNATISGDQSICAGNTATLTFAVVGNGSVNITYQDIFNNTQAGVFTATGAGNGNPFTVSVTNLAAGTHTFTIISSTDANGTTPGGNGSATVIASTPPDVNQPSNVTVCANGNVPDITFTGSSANTIYAWTNNNTGIGLAASGTGTIASFTALNGTSSAQTATITVTPQIYFSQTFAYTGTMQVWTVPAGVTSINIDVKGAQGGNNFGAVGGKGGRVTATLNVTPGQTYNIFVGGQGGGTGPAGYNGGGAGNSGGGAGGGGGSDIRFGGTAFSDRIVVAGGGGGGDSNCGGSHNGGDGGGLTGANGLSDVSCFGCTNVTVPTGGTQSAGGAGGTSSCGWNGSNGSFGTGGNGYNNYISAGGGGGWYGGGGGHNSMSGAGGSSYTIPAATNVNHTQGFNTGNGSITISWSNSSCPGQPKTFNINVNPQPTATISGGTTVCAGSGTQTITFTGANGTAPYTFTYSINGGGNQTVSTAGGNNTATVNQSTLVAGAFSYTVINVQAASGCTQTQTGTAVINVNPSLDVSQPANVIACANGSVPTITFTSSSSITAFTWTNSNTSIGLAAGGTGTITSFTTLNTTSSAQTATITVTPSPGSGVTTQTFNFTGTIDTWVVPAGVTSVRIEARGAEGSFNTSSSVRPGKGSIMSGDFSVTPGSTLKILVGQQFSSTASNGGGGGTFVTDNSNNPLIIAGGGGGASGGIDSPSKDGQTGTTGGTGASGGGTGGTSGNGGNAGAGSFQGGGGGGLLTNGADGSGGAGSGGQAFVNGGGGGTTNAHGGFGGGGSGSGNNVGGGGGGYSGGGSGANISGSGGVGGGGGSYNAGTNQANTAGGQSGNGIVYITYSTGVLPCTGTPKTFTITVNPLTTATIAGNATVCAGSATQTVTFTGAHGTAPYTFTYSVNGGAATSVTSAAGTNTATVKQSAAIAGTFTYSLISVYDANGTSCINAQTGTVTVRVNALPTATFSGTTSQTTCSGSAGILTATLTGSGNYIITYQYSNGATTTSTTVSVSGSTLTITVPPPAASGTYTFAITNIIDGNGCTNVGSNTATQTIKPVPAATITGNAIVCLNSTAPVVTFTGTGGPPPYTFIYRVNGGTVTTVSTVGGSASVTVIQSTAVAGTFAYTLVSVSNGNDCTQAQTGTVTVIVNSQVATVLEVTNVPCNGTNNGSINVRSISGGNPPYTFSKNGVDFFNAPSSGPTFQNLTAGIYNTYVKDATGCIWAMGTSTITQPSAMVVTVTQDASLLACSNATTTLQVSVIGGTPSFSGYTYSIDNGTPQSSNVLTAGIGTHNITVTDAVGCTFDTTINIVGIPYIVYNSINVTNNTCYNSILGQIAVNATAASGTITYTLTASGGTQTTRSAASGTTTTFTGLAAGTYTISAVDNNNCPAVRTATVTQPSIVMAPDNSNGAPDLLLTSVINPPTATFTQGGSVTISYTVSVKNNSNIAAHGVIIRVTKPFSGYHITATGGVWTKITENNNFAEFQLNAGLEIACSGSMTAVISIARAGNDSSSPGLPVTASVRMSGSAPDTHDQDNARASQFRVQ